MAVCAACTSGRHPHDTWTTTAPEVHAGEHRAGEDAGCPNIADTGPCECPHRKPPQAPRHCSTCRCENQ